MSVSTEQRMTILADLRRITGCKTHVDLMNFIQDRGLVSDLCVTVEDVPDSDLMSALVKLSR